MEDNLRNYMDNVFSDIQPTKKSVELKEEILQNLIDKYHDLIDDGKSSEAAYNLAIASLGDTSELLESFRKTENTYDLQYDSEETLKAKKKSAVLFSTAIALYIISVIPPIIFSYISDKGFLGEVLGPCLMFVIIAVATALIIYNEMTKPKYKKADDTLVEEFKEWQQQNDSDTRALKSITSALWSLVIVVYILVSFLTGAWYITWVIFLIGAAIEKIIKASFELRKK